MNDLASHPLGGGEGNNHIRVKSQQPEITAQKCTIPWFKYHFVLFRCVILHSALEAARGLIGYYFMVHAFSFVIRQPLFNLHP